MSKYIYSVWNYKTPIYIILNVNRNKHVVITGERSLRQLERRFPGLTLDPAGIEVYKNSPYYKLGE